jgi:hypothetical protein
LSGKPMDDYIIFREREKKLDIIIADSKMGFCDINSSWLLPELRNMERILYVLGIFHEVSFPDVIPELYNAHFYEDEHIRINLYTLGAKIKENLPISIIQLTWEEVLRFIHERFVEFEDYKTQHDQWDDTGKNLYINANRFRKEPNQFADFVIARLIK